MTIHIKKRAETELSDPGNYFILGRRFLIRFSLEKSKFFFIYLILFGIIFCSKIGQLEKELDFKT